MMSMLTDFKNDLPLTPLKLTHWLDAILTKIDGLRQSTTMNFTFLSNISNNINKGTDITSTFSASNFEKLFTDIKAGKTIVASSTNTTVNIVYASVNEVASDDFKSIEIAYIYDGKLHTLTFSKFGTTVYLDNKSITTL